MPRIWEASDPSMRVVAATFFCLGIVGTVHAGPVEKKQLSAESLVHSVAVSIGSAANALAKAERINATQLKLVRTSDLSRPQQIAYQGLTRSKTQLRTGTARAATVIRIGYPRCLQTHPQCQESAATRTR